MGVFLNFVCLFVLLCCAGDHQKFRTVSPKHTEERERERGIGQASKRVVLSTKSRSILSVVVFALMLCT